MNWRQSLIPDTANIHDAIAAIEGGHHKIALVVDRDGRLIGTVTDGDIRRGILRGVSLDDPVSNVLNAKPTVMSVGESRDRIMAVMKAKELHQIPLLDRDNKVVGLEGIDDLLDGEANTWVVLMAGGQGKRLRPLTEHTAKPMLPVGNKPLLETIIEGFVRQSFRKFYISVNYMADQITSHFGDGRRWGVEIRYLQESTELGTGGALSLIEDLPATPLLVMNGDLLTDVNFHSLLAYHREQKALATMAVREFEIEVPFGVVVIDGQKIARIDEKPVHRFLINAGIYVLEPSVIDMIERGHRTDMPEVFEKVITAGKMTAVFPVREYWLDMGHPEQYLLANRDIHRLGG